MLKTLAGCSLTALLLLSTSAHAVTPAFGNVSVVQNNTNNNAGAVTVTVSYSSGTFVVRSGSNRGDFNVSLSATPLQDRNNGILITNVSQLFRDNSNAGDLPGNQYATSAIDFDTAAGGGYFVPIATTGDFVPTVANPGTLGGDEWNVNFAGAYFAYADGWIGGHVTNSANNGALTTVVGSSGLTVSTVGPGSNVIYDSAASNGVYELNLTGINSMTDGILLVVGGKNEDNYALSHANADGTWTVIVKDNGSDSTTYENDSFGFVYVPKTAVVADNETGIHVLGKVNGDLTRDFSVGEFVMTRSGVGDFRLYAPGINSATATLMLSPESAGVATDNIFTYEARGKGWALQSRDLPDGGLQTNTATADTLGFVIMSGAISYAKWDAEGANTRWSTTANWVGDAAPTTGLDVVMGLAGSAADVDTAQTVGMMVINRDTAFTLSGSAALTVNAGIVLSSSPSSAQTHIISAPIILGQDAFIISSSLTSSANTLRFDVASGNAITSAGKSLTLDGSGPIEFRDSISLGAGLLVKDGIGQVTLNNTNIVGGTVIYGGPDSTTTGAFKLNAAAAYGAFGTADIRMTNSITATALYFDTGAGSGTLANNIILQSATAGAGVRFLVDAAAGFNVTLSGLISGGNGTSEMIVDADAANGQGHLHLTNLGNTFLASRININRGALMVYGDSALGNASNGLYLNTNNTNANTGLHFAADGVVLGTTRTVTVAATTVINTSGHDATIDGEITGAGQINKEGEGTLTLTNANNTLTGKVRVTQGAVAISSEGNLGMQPGTFVADQLSFNGGRLKAQADLDINDGNRGVTFDAGGATIDTQGHRVTLGSVITGGGGLIKEGAGTLELTASNTYQGTTYVVEGTLALNNVAGSGTGLGTVEVSSGATLAGNGTFGGEVKVEGILAPGFSAGTLTFEQGLDLLGGSRTVLEIDNVSGRYDHIIIGLTGSLYVDPLAVFEIIIHGLPVTDTSYKLLDWTRLEGDMNLADNFILPNLSEWGMTWDTSRLGSEGVLGIAGGSAAPEPSRALLLMGGLAACLMRRRRSGPLTMRR